MILLLTPIQLKNKKAVFFRMKKGAKLLSRVGRGILETESETNQSVAGGIWVMENCSLSRDKWVKSIDSRLLPTQERLRSCLSSDGKSWVPMPEGWSCAEVVKQLTIQATRWEDVETVLSRLHSTRLEEHMGVPLWSLYILEGFEDKQILFWRWSHAVGDGVSFAAVTTVFLSDDLPSVNIDSGPSFSSYFRLLWWFLWGWLLVLLRWAKDAVFYKKQPRIFERMGSLTGRKRVCCTLDGVCTVQEAKDIAHRSPGATLNDVCLTALSRGLARYTRTSSSSLLSSPLSASAASTRPHLAVAVPVNIRLSNADTLLLRNVFGSISFFLPVHSDGTFQDALARVTSITQFTKKLPEAYVGYGLMALATSFLPRSMARKLVDFFASKIMCSVSNVVGTRRLHFNDVLCETIIGFVPPPNGVALGIAILSYGDQVFLSVSSDECLMPNPRALLNEMMAEIRSALSQR